MCPCCQQHGPFKVDQEQTIYRNYQKLAIQEPPGAIKPDPVFSKPEKLESVIIIPGLGNVPPGRMPRHKNIILLADLVDIARPGEEVEITGVYVHSFHAAQNQLRGISLLFKSY